MGAMIEAVSFYLGEEKLDNETLTARQPDWPVHKIAEKTGIHLRHISKENCFSLELAIEAGRKLFLEHDIRPDSIDYVIFCSQTPKFLIPTSACVLQHALGLPTHIGAFDLNQGCSGYVTGLMLANSLIQCQHAERVLLITADTYTKLLHPDDRSLKTIMSDAASATVISAAGNDRRFHHFEFGTDGAGAQSITAEFSGVKGLLSGSPYLQDFKMNGGEVFNFVISTLPDLISKLIARMSLQLSDIDLFIFHQANSHMLESVRAKMDVSRDKFFVAMNDVGNTGSSSIPIAISQAIQAKKLVPGQKVVFAGFGAGLSWNSCIMDY
ncbi:3-oxoacyl-ACP synthase III family protein [Undibacterium sp. Dicai25W]|uniref:3-oxoacyl-ACP synthase III family protein n=1 Tax=Undibacterium sp. Dicai25W TaxID=3413034 RepID=UPI003BF30AAD